MIKQKQSVNINDKLIKQSGNVLVIVAIVVVVLALVGGIGYAWVSQSSKKSDTVEVKKNNDQPKTSGVSVTMLSGKLSMIAVDGWTKGTETNLIKDIDGTSFRVAIQPQGVDYLKLDTVGGYATEFSKVKTTQNTQLYILKIGIDNEVTNLAVSTCAPADGFGCSPELDGSMLYVVLAPLGDGSSVIAPLDYSLPATTKAISDFEKIAQNLPV